jgi:tagatose 1,6-diphosphate aldolase
MSHVATDGMAGRLDRLATDTGQFAILALDHARSFAATIRPDDPDSLSSDEILATKDRLIDGISREASAVLVDPAVAMRRSGLGNGRLIVGIEDGDYGAQAASPRLLPGWSVKQAVDLGAQAVKISFSFEPLGETRPAERFVAETVRQCEQAGIPLFCEPLARLPMGGDTRQGVHEGIRRFGDLGAQVLKIQFPADTSQERSRAMWADAAAEASELSPIPWALLSEGREFEDFRELLDIACRAGASGFVAGRAIWGPAGGSEAEIATARARLTELRSIAIAHGRPWRRHASAPAERTHEPPIDSVSRSADGPRGASGGGEVL